MKKLLLLATTILTLTCLTNCSGGDDDKNSANTSGGAPDSLVGKVFRCRQYWLLATGWVDIARQDLDIEFLSDTVAKQDVVIFSSDPPYNILYIEPNVTYNYTYKKTGPNTGYVESHIGDPGMPTTYKSYWTIIGNKATATGTITDAYGVYQSKAEGRFIK